MSLGDQSHAVVPDASTGCAASDFVVPPMVKSITQVAPGLVWHTERASVGSPPSPLTDSR